MRRVKQTTQSGSVRGSAVTKRMFMLVIGLVLVFVFVQFLKLSTVGRIGNEIAAIKTEQKQLELDNELLKAEINKLKSPSNLESALPTYGEFVSVPVEVISLERSNEVAIITE
ncbi:hypothetical protein KC717_01395 [Candidatus Dojkabacteria bacterium]|uniref:Uncharacterized protein n=1 Tax=Candidatus Dojkabacteria bacterium TaxID=2099670 RepID=A0A955L7X1_9BACT|nr:hypothetical protein [Candidatus Dojkabacteria bacterium]